MLLHKINVCCKAINLPIFSQCLYGSKFVSPFKDSEVHNGHHEDFHARSGPLLMQGYFCLLSIKLNALLISLN